MISSSSVMLVSTSICLCLLFASTCSKSGWAYEDGHLGAAGVVADGALPEAQEEESHDPELAFEKALECFSDRYIYSGCDEAYRVGRDGEVEVPHEYTDEYCDGPCRKETGLVLDCVEEISKHFRFLNRATVKDVRETVDAGCSYGPKRGEFDVAEHVRADEDTAIKLSSSLVYAAAPLILIMGCHLLF